MKNGDICKYVLRGYECRFIGKFDDTFSVVHSSQYGVETLPTSDLVPVGNSNDTLTDTSDVRLTRGN